MKRFRFFLLSIMFAAGSALAQHSTHHSDADKVHKGTGVVTKVDRAAGRVTLKHDPIPSLNWPAMTMAFNVKDKAMLDKVEKDRKVEFEFVQQDKRNVITSIK